MAKNSITDYSKTAASNTDIQSVDIAEGCLPSGINNAIREIMADLADMNDGTVTLTSPSFAAATITGDLTVDTNTLYVDSTNNRVGINDATPSEELDINGDGSDVKIRMYDGAGASVGRIEHSGANFDISNTATSTATMTFTTGSGSGTERLRIDSSGNVGIGTSSPATALDVNGTVTANALTVDGGATNFPIIVTSADQYAGIAFADNTTTTNAHVAVYADGNNLAFEAGNAERLRIDSSGNVLVNKTSTAIDPMGCMLKPNGQIFATTNGSDSFHNYDTSQNRYEFYVKGNGGIANYSSNNVNLSDETEKKNITAAASAWDDVKGLSLKEFHYTFEDDADPKQLGVIAQDVQVNHPDLIKSFKIDDDTDKLGVVEQQITWMAIKALQEAITKIEDLEARVATLEGN